MLRDDVKILKQSEDPRYNLDGTVTRYIRVEFFVGTHGPFIERFEKESFTRDVRDAKLTAFADQVRTE